MSAGVLNFSWIRGNDAPAKPVTFKDSDGAVIPLTGSTFQYRAVTDAGSVVIDRTLTPGDDDTVDIALTLAESRLLPLGALTAYEVERRIDGTQETWLMGTIAGLGGVNPDD